MGHTEDIVDLQSMTQASRTVTGEDLETFFLLL